MKRALAVVVVASLVTACAASKSRDAQAPAAPSSSPATGGSGTGAAEAYGQPAAPQQPGYAPPPSPPPPSAGAEPSSTAPAPHAQPSGASGSRAVALQQASSDIEAAQRELDVSGGDCRNACRALGSMDRAAGRVCSLTRDDGTHDRCDDAKRRLYGARDRVRNTCGTCPDGQPAVDRNAPVPSMR